MGKVIAVITTRWNSVRFPGKALAPIFGKPLTRHIVDTLNDVKGIDKVVVVPTSNSQPIVDYCKEHGIDCLPHHKDYDYLGQLFAVTLAYEPSKIVRVWGDCPFISAYVVERTLEYSEGFDYTYCSNVPVGEVISVIPRRSISLMAREMTEQEKHYFNEIDEHKFFHVHDFRVNVWHCDRPLINDNLSVDYPEDIPRLEKLLAGSEGTY